MEMNFNFQEFIGNLVEDIVTKHHLAIPVKARYVQFQPTEMVSSVCMRVELYGEKSTVENTGNAISLIFDILFFLFVNGDLKLVLPMTYFLCLCATCLFQFHCLFHSLYPLSVSLYQRKTLFSSNSLLLMSADKPAVYQRSILLDAKHRRLFLCSKDVIR